MTYQEERVSWRRRLTRATLLFILNVVLWVVLPSLLLQYVTSLVPPSSVPFSLDLIYAFGAVITSLQVLGALTEGMLVSVPFDSGSYLATAIYIWVVLNGGFLALTARGITFAISFQALVFLAVLPPLYGAVRVPLAYLLDVHEASRAAPDAV